jgi:Rrf2 family nitric oxide-sensitive transcriptional repressor
MRLTLHSDYALRLLIQLALSDARPAPIAEVARAHRISHNHLVKVAATLVRAGLVESVRGRSGGLRLARPAQSITVGQVLRLTEDSLEPARCADCVWTTGCTLQLVLEEGMQAMFAVFDGRSIADLAGRGDRLRALLREGATA